MTIRSVKIYGAGSIGNHLARAARTLGWRVVVCDVDPRALVRMQTDIYPARYGAWDPSILLALVGDEPVGGFDLICVGTPPDVHLTVARQALDESPAALLIEKPLCPPGLAGLEAFRGLCAESGTRVFVGYDHVVGRAVRHAETLFREGVIGPLVTLDVEFREHWAGIFAAHPWLSGPADTYVGFWRRGGGASGEHSHALNLWQHFARVASAGRVREVMATIRYLERDGAEYDDVCALQLVTENGLAGRVVQDVVTRPASKRAVLQGELGALEWVCGYDAAGDAVILRRPGHAPQVTAITKTRADDFLEELTFIAQAVKGEQSDPSLDLERGIDTMVVLNAAHRSQQEGRRVAVDYPQPTRQRAAFHA